MPIENRPKRSDYQKKLKADIDDYVRNCPRNGPARSEQEITDEIEGVYNLVRDIALESYRNGVAVGKRARRTLGNDQGSALQNGKLTPVRTSN